MRFGSICSGIEAASVAWHPLGWRAQFLSKIDRFPCAALAHHFPTTPNLGDMTRFKEWPDYAIDLLIGGTPCQAFSVAGLRKGLADPRGNLTLVFLAIAAKYRPRWLAWENVPGVLSDKSGAFGALLGGLGQLGYGFAYRILDAQYFGVPQRRRRVFVVGHLGNWRRAAAVLFERHSLQGNHPPSRETREGIAGTLSARTEGGGGLGTDFELGGGLVAPTLDASYARLHGQDNQHIDGGAGLYHVERLARCDTAGEGRRMDGETCNFVAHTLRAQSQSAHDTTLETYITHTLRAEGFDASEDGTGRGTPLIPTTFPWQLGGSMQMSTEQDLCGTLVKNQTHAVQRGSGVRRLTPRECERLQGFPDDWTQIPYRGKPAGECPDGPRYKALGNSMAVPVMRWIGERIAAVDAIPE